MKHTLTTVVMKQLKPAISILWVMVLITGGIYPLLITGLAQLFFPHQSNGSLLVQADRIIGSELIGQQFDQPQYFWGRLSATAGTPYNAAASGGSNYSVLNPALQTRVEQLISALEAAHPENAEPVPVDLVTASASGLDPHISVASAYYQAARIANARQLSLDQITTLIDQYTHPRDHWDSWRKNDQRPGVKYCTGCDTINLMMEEHSRPDPDKLLARLQSEQKSSSRGKLKVFLGYVAGVGKTYAMLEAAHQRRAEGVDIVVGYVETHGRKETESLLSGLEIIPRREITYRGINLTEMDLDAIITRHPQIVLVDELAHTNNPGSRHPKRYQDVEEILRAGIDVYSTVNIQHLESLSDVVQQITGVVVREKIPDRLIDEADEIELIDLPTDEILNRLRDGKVYISDQAMRALEKFFRKGNLSALRELSLRRAADRVDSQMLNYMQTKSIPGPWPTTERILVCISSHPMGERLIRSGRRLADVLNAEWYVLFVETPQHLRMPVENRVRVQQFLTLAEDLGAKVARISGNSVAESVISYARERNITKIVAGKPFRPRWYEILRGSVIDQIIQNSGSIDVTVVSDNSITTSPVKIFGSALRFTSGALA